MQMPEGMMPTYEYKCRSCGHQFEIQQSISEDALTECPECDGDLRKLFSPVGISFKGSGFYANDARSSSGSSSNGSGGSSSSTTSTSSGSDSSSSGTSQSSSGSEATSGSSSSSD